MQTRKDAIEACLKFDGAYEDYPFDDPNWTVMRHKGNNRSFALIFEHDGVINVNVKARPAAAEAWREIFPWVVPAYHMNKTHWVGILLSPPPPEKEALMLIFDSYELTKPKRKETKNN